MNIEGWLRSLGLEQYEAAFRENKIDREVLPQLTAEDLKDIGVTIVGDRRKMLTAICGTVRFVHHGRRGRAAAASVGAGVRGSRRATAGPISPCRNGAPNNPRNWWNVRS